MKLNNKGFAISGVLYPVFILFLALVFTILSLLANRKIIFDKTRTEIMSFLDNQGAKNMPKITVKGKEITLSSLATVPNYEYNIFEGVSATKANGNPIDVSKIMFSSTPAYNPRQTGDYDIIYKVKDDNGNIATALRTVHVVDPVEYVYQYTGSKQVFIPSKAGLYLFQAWGASGADNEVSGAGGKGAYVSGMINISENNIKTKDADKAWRFWVYVGEKGDNYNSNTRERDYVFNGGGYGSKTCKESSYTGGGASDIRFIPDDYLDGNNKVIEKWDYFEGLKARIMVAGAGGSAGYKTNGGAGGGLSSKNAATSVNGAGGLGATQALSTSGGTFGRGGDSVVDNVNNNYCTDPTLSNTNGAGGGGGYFGGGGSRLVGYSYGGAGAGGSSYISGYEGCQAITSNSTQNSQNFQTTSIHSSGISFTNGQMISGENKMPTHDGRDTMTGNTGNGYVRIVLIRTIDEK
jgi:hypothetical protein